MRPINIKEVLKWVVKISITVVAMYFVFTKVDFQSFKANILSTNPLFLVLAFITFNISKTFSAFRIYQLFKELGVSLTHVFNLKLTYVGMFYNLFLPGAIGGDGYKVYIIKKAYGHLKTKLLIAASLLDRINGLAILFILACLLALKSSLEPPFQYFEWLTVILALLVLPVFYVFCRFFFSSFDSAFLKTTAYSLYVQLTEVGVAFLLLKSIGISDHYFDYLTLFMISSVVAVLPFTVGGVGARELVFLYGYQYLNIQEEKAVAFTVLFFAVTAITSLLGLFFSFTIEQKALDQKGGWWVSV